MESWQKIVLVACGILLALECCAVWSVRRTTSSKPMVDTTTTSMQHRSLLGTTSSKQRPTTIINVGLPRTGSEFLYDYFVCQGIPARHRDCCRTDESSSSCRNTCGECIARNLQNLQRPPWKNCGDEPKQPQTSLAVQAFLQIDVETSQPYSWFLPQHGALESLVAEDEQAIWILTLRANATIWAESVLHWHSVTQRLIAALDIPLSNQQPASLELPQPVTHEQVVESLRQSVARAHDDGLWKTQRDRLAQAYTRHVQHVRTTAATHQVPLVEIVVDEDSTMATAWHQALMAQGVPLQSTLSSCWQGYDGRYETDWQDFSFSL